MVHTALITGASSGIGAEYAKQLAADGTNLVLVARDRAALTSLAAALRSKVSVEVLAADLLKPRQLKKVIARLTSESAPIDMLVNNAGFGLPLDFALGDIDREVDHLHLHVEVPMRLMHAALQSMRVRGGHIVNVASIAAYIPRSTYGAAKQWLVNFSRWANQYYDGVGVTAVCPGYTHTNFHERLGLTPGEEGVAAWLWLDAPLVVRQSLRDAARGKSVSIPSLRYKLIAAGTRLLPDSVLTRVGASGR